MRHVVDASTGERADRATPVAPAELLAIRDGIDAIDRELVPLLAARLALVASAWRHKTDLASVGDPARVDDVLSRVRAHAEACGADLDAVDHVYRELIGQGIELERQAFEHGRSETGASLPPAAPVAIAPAAGPMVMSVMSTMRAMRRLDDRPVAPELLDALVRAASWAPIGTNRQAHKFLVVTDRSQLAELAPLWAKAMEFHVGALRLPVAIAESRQAERVLAAIRYQRDHFKRTPALIVVCYEPVSFWRRVIHDPRRAIRQLRTLPLRDRVQVLVNLRRWSSRASSASVYPAVENLLLAARAYGLGANLTTWHCAFEQQFKSVLGVPDEVGIYAIVPVGYPLGRFGPVRRRPVEEIVVRERWSGGDDGRR